MPARLRGSPNSELNRFAVLSAPED